MVHRTTRAMFVLLLSCCTLSGYADEPKKGEKPPAVVTIALLPFQERGREAKDFGPKVTDLLFAKLVANPELFLVDRQDLEKILKESQLNLSGLVNPGQATTVGQLTGAKVLLSGSVIQVDNDLYLVAKLIGTETSRVLGASVKGRVDGALDNLVEKLSVEIGKTVSESSKLLIAPPAKNEDYVAAMNKALGDRKRPVVYIDVTERHVGRTTIDPAAATEIALLCKKTGFKVIDSPEDKALADVVIKGEGFSEFAARHGELISVKARLEIKVVNRQTGELLASDRQTAVAVDLSEQIAGKTALADAAARIAERLLPQIAREKKDQKNPDDK
jgi:TolB-like protein